MYDIDETGGVGPIRRKRVVRKGRQEEQLKAQAQICQEVADAIVKRRVRPHERATPSDSEEPKTPDLENGSRVISVSPPNRMESDAVDVSANHTPANAPSNPSTPPQQVAPVLQPPQPPISPSPAPTNPPSTFSRHSPFASFASRPVAYGFSRNVPTAPVEPLFRTPQVESAAKSMTTSSSGWVSGRMPANGFRPVIGDDRWSIRPSLPRTDNPRRPLVNLDDEDDED
ncbi:hypothetical protein SCHPADRAFT_711474 [Schizopora paradoxa]|uniref:Uncharacterized protein n=1 Tax=Schizopora paradoxa TaxID=27342 RepID=A0A0H2RLT1_9AGAM|nr:hypothetical protein SCHPADRAFT_711474 [Schizopora paradoxa]